MSYLQSMQKIILSTMLSAVSFLVHAQGPLTVQGDSVITAGGYRIQLSKQGFPEQIDSLLAENIHFHFTRQSDGKDIRLTSGGLHITRDGQAVAWKDTCTSDELRMEVGAGLRSNGYLSYRVKVTALQDLDIKDITMHIPFQPEKAKLIKGLGLPYGPRPDSNYRWKWDAAGQKGPAAAWIGTADEGLQCFLVPGVWDNGGKGGVIVGIKGKSMLLNNYSGPRHLQKGDSLDYYFVLMVTKGK